MQCPNCGGFKSEEQYGLDDIVKVPFGLLFLIGIVGYFANFYLKLNITYDAAKMAAIIIAPILLFLSIIYAIAHRNEFRCRLCGYQWNQSKIPAGTQIQVKQDLIEKGNILLEQEELERQRRKEEQRRRDEEQRQQEAYYYNQNK